MVVHPVEGEISDQHYSKQVRSHMVLFWWESWCTLVDIETPLQH